MKQMMNNKILNKMPRDRTTAFHPLLHRNQAHRDSDANKKRQKKKIAKDTEARSNVKAKQLRINIPTVQDDRKTESGTKAIPHIDIPKKKITRVYNRNAARSVWWDNAWNSETSR
jgi:hypothetical protein